MRGQSGVLVVLLLILIAAALSVVVHATVIATVDKRPRLGDFSPIPRLLGGFGVYKLEGEAYKVNLTLLVSSCKGTADAYVTLLGVSEGKEFLLGSAPVSSCTDRSAEATLYVDDPNFLGHEEYRAYLWKFGAKSETVTVTLFESQDVSTNPPPIVGVEP